MIIEVVKVKKWDNEKSDEPAQSKILIKYI